MTIINESEADFESWLRDAAELTGWMVYHTLRSKGSHAGFPDYVLAKPGRLVFLELKREGQFETPEQREWLDTLCPEGQDYSTTDVSALVVRPQHRDLIEQLLGLRRA